MKKVVIFLTLALFAQMMHSYAVNHTKTMKKLTVKQLLLPCCDEDDDFGKKRGEG
jgi:hypothetical protein